MKSRKKRSFAWVLPVLLFALLGLPLVGCAEEQGPMEELGEDLDEAVEDARDSAEEIGDDVEDAIDDIGDGAEEAADEVEEATDGGSSS